MDYFKGEDTSWSEALLTEIKQLGVRCEAMKPDLSKPDEAKLIAFLASDEATWITGQIIHSDGGFL